MKGIYEQQEVTVNITINIMKSQIRMPSCSCLFSLSHHVHEVHACVRVCMYVGACVCVYICTCVEAQG